MTRCVVDTNVPIVANGRADEGDSLPSIDCRQAAVEFLIKLRATGRVVLDLAGEIQSEYRRKLLPSGQPGVGDRFYQIVLSSAPRLVEFVPLPKTSNGNYADFPADPRLERFDPSDRKFAALSRRERIPVINATDSDWLEHREALAANGIEIRFLCGRDPSTWFERPADKRRKSSNRRR